MRLILPIRIVGCGAGRAVAVFVFVLIGRILSGRLETSHTV
jgi:hypothetical protein